MKNHVIYRRNYVSAMGSTEYGRTEKVHYGGTSCVASSQKRKKLVNDWSVHHGFASLLVSTLLTHALSLFYDDKKKFLNFVDILAAVKPKGKLATTWGKMKGK